ncbi:GNAT family N-acetyltransferase [Candidatus Bipolaricaulota bacterium]|nr:GNAT family N-acetyltransferase [Candidatus Bipolaricaulota bacterium]
MDRVKKSVYVAYTMNTPKPRVVIATKSHLKALEALVHSIAAEDHPERLDMAENASEGMYLSLGHFDMLASDCAWVLIALDGDQPAGLAVLSRIPKLDSRLGFLYLDELHVLPKYRRQGIGRALLARSISLTRDLGLAGIRLLSRIDNEPARQLYESMGFIGSGTMLYQIRFDRRDAQL